MNKNANRVWNDCLVEVKSTVSVNAFNRWFKPIKPIELLKDELVIQVPNPFFYEYIEEHYVEILRTAIAKVMGNSGKLKYQILMPDSRKNRRDEKDLDFTPGTYTTNGFFI